MMEQREGSISKVLGGRGERGQGQQSCEVKGRKETVAPVKERKRWRCAS